MGNITFETLLGLTIARITGLEVGSDDVVLLTECGRTFRMHHYRDCCEDVHLADITGDVADLIGSPILRAEEATSDASADVSDSSGTWTFYKLATRKGYVDIRWLGESNGYYSEAVDFEEVK
ncbi:hypothetical protein ACJBUE_20830 (plasmid) [Ralstonia syzygii subsp. celebesensis]|uniref:DUF7448 domain-containing protein n=1 Tax=blood disease bacterium R229 TaxID=741978 RepID=G2ZVY4_9RALS|nr:hypothetical protein [Ralstonia syzygii]QQV57842.1 hypothetical protein JK151_20675 [Ralstonia syzygii subsp. celebesensis]CCA83265.1 conserved hypothetical protein [blood disease bacterium R229]